jgi:hypothetical protein
MISTTVYQDLVCPATEDLDHQLLQSIVGGQVADYSAILVTRTVLTIAGGLAGGLSGPGMVARAGANTIADH